MCVSLKSSGGTQAVKIAAAVGGFDGFTIFA
jgi:hypothetical protein